MKIYLGIGFGFGNYTRNGIRNLARRHIQIDYWIQTNLDSGAISDSDSEWYSDSGLGSVSDTGVISIQVRIHIVMWVTVDPIANSNSEFASISDSDLDSNSDTRSNSYSD